MKPWQQRVIDEKIELDEKLAKLATFVQSKQAEAVSPDEMARLNHQQYLMDLYSDILKKRIEAFT